MLLLAGHAPLDGIILQLRVQCPSESESEAEYQNSTPASMEIDLSKFFPLCNYSPRSDSANRISEAISGGSVNHRIDVRYTDGAPETAPYGFQEVFGNVYLSKLRYLVKKEIANVKCSFGIK